MRERDRKKERERARDRAIEIKERERLMKAERKRDFEEKKFSSTFPSIELGAPPIHILSRTLTTEL